MILFRVKSLDNTMISLICTSDVVPARRWHDFSQSNIHKNNALVRKNLTPTFWFSWKKVIILLLLLILFYSSLKKIRSINFIRKKSTWQRFEENMHFCTWNLWNTLCTKIRKINFRILRVFIANIWNEFSPNFFPPTKYIYIKKKKTRANKLNLHHVR